MGIAKNKVDAAFEIMQKLSIDYFCFHDRDLAPEGDNLAKSNRMLDEISNIILDRQSETGIKCL